MKITSTRYGRVHYHAGCNHCNFTSAIFGPEKNSPNDVRNAVYKHIRKTGHTCWIECGTHTVYSPAEQGQEGGKA